MFTLNFFIFIWFNFINIAFTLINKKLNFIVFFMLLFMWLLFSGNIENADYANYLLRYEYIQQTGQGFLGNELGFTLLMKIAAYFSLSYNQFLMIVSAIALSLIYSSIKLYTKHTQYVLSLYFIYPFLLDIVQVRHFLAMSIIVYAIRFVERKSYLKYIISIILAFNIQFSAILYLPFIFFEKMKIKKIWFISLSVIIIGIFLVNTSFIVSLISLVVPIEKISLYFNNRAGIGFLVQWIIPILFLIPLYIIYTNIHLRIVEIVYKLNIYLLMLFPLTMINGTSARVFRMAIILNLIIYAIGFFQIKSNYTKYTLFFYVLFLAIGMYFLEIYPLPGVLDPIFHKNIILS